MQRKEIPAIIEDDFLIFLKENGLFERFQNGEMKCFYCHKTLNENNISAIFNNNGIQFCCDDIQCIDNLNRPEINQK